MTSTNRNSPFAVDGEMAALMRAKDWSGDAARAGRHVAAEPSHRRPRPAHVSLRDVDGVGTGADLLLQRRLRRDDARRQAPWALGRPSREVWAEIWPEIGPRIEQRSADGPGDLGRQAAALPRAQRLPGRDVPHLLLQSGHRRQRRRLPAHLCVVTEETERVLGERRMALLRDTAAAIAATITESELFTALAGALIESKDLPFTLTYLFDDGGQRARLTCRTGIAEDHPAAAAIDRRRRSERAMAPRHDLNAFARDRGSVADGSRTCRQGRGSGRPPRRSCCRSRSRGRRALPASSSPRLNPFRPVDDAYRSFVDLFVGQIAAGLANAHAYEAERRRAQALAEIDRAKTTFFSNVSHEFRTPLTLLLGPLDDARRAGDAVPREIRDQLDVAHRNGQRLLKLVNTLLDFSRIEAGRVRARFEPVDLVCPDRPISRAPSARRWTRRDSSSSSSASAWRSLSTSIARCGRRSSSTSSPTRSSSHSPAGSPSSCRSRMNGRCSRCATPASASPNTNCRACSNASIGSKARRAAATKARASASRWCRSS